MPSPQQKGLLMTKPVGSIPSQTSHDKGFKEPVATDSFKGKGVVVTKITPERADEIAHERFISEISAIGKRITANG